MNENKLGTAAELGALIDEFKIATLFTRGGDGQYHARPMGIQKRETDQSIWFSTLIESSMVKQIELDPRCAVYLQDGPQSQTWVSLSGRAEISQDRAKIKELWNPSMAIWFPEGQEQPDIALVHFHPEHAEYIKGEGGKVGALLLAAKMFVFKETMPKQEKKQVELR